MSLANSPEPQPEKARAGLRARFDARSNPLRRVPAGGSTLLRSGPMEVRATPLARFRADTGPWRELIERAIEPNVFLEPDVALAALGNLSGDDVTIVTVHSGARIVGLLPGRTRGFASGRPVPVFVAWTHPYAPLSAPLLDRDVAAEAMQAMLAAIPALSGAPKAALFPLLPEASVAARMIALGAATRGRSVERFNVHARAALVREPEEALGMTSARRMKELRRQRRRLSELGYLEHVVTADAREVRSALADFIALEERGWKGRSGDSLSRNPGAANFAMEALTGLAAERKVRIDRLRLDDRTIAAAITLYSGDYAWFWKIAYDEAYARHSPGVQIALDLTEVLAVDRSVTLVDSCAVADHPMIDHLWSGRIAMADWLVPLDGPASFAAATAAERVRRSAIAPLRMLRARLRRRRD